MSNKKKFGSLSQEDAFMMQQWGKDRKSSNSIEWEDDVDVEPVVKKKESYTGGIVHTPSCYESHPALKVGTKLIYGGSCAYPVVKDADVYVGLDASMRSRKTKYPWEAGVEDHVGFLYKIADMNPPSDAKSFHEMVDWLCLQLIMDKKVHIGCIGGHGRTGTLLTAIVSQMTGEADAIAYVRKNYCHKAVESRSQIKFLMKEFGVEEAAGTKEFTQTSRSTHTGWWPTGATTTKPTSGGWAGKLKVAADKKASSVSFSGSVKLYTPVPSTRNIWSLV